jgi:carbonic anhydrase
MWIVFRQPISVSATQMKEFRELLCESGHSMADNFRPVQKLNDRVVWTTLQV